MIRFYNGRVLSFGAGLSISEGEVWTDGGDISYVGPERAELPLFDREIDLGGDLIMPGFKNAHTHTAMTFLRSLADDLPLDDWLKKQVFPKERLLAGEDIYNFTKLGIMEYLSSGVTSVFDMYLDNAACAAAAIDCGYRFVLCSGFSDRYAEPEQVERDYLNFNSLHELVSFRLGFHAEYSTSLKRLEYIASLSEKYGEGVCMHCSETRAEVDGCISRYGLTPPQLMERLGLLRYGGSAFHCVWVNEEDVSILARHGVYAVTNPASNLKLASGIAPLGRMREGGVRLALGTDGAASNNALDMFREMYLASALQKYLCGDAAAMGADAVLAMACVGGAEAMGLSCCDDLAAGKKADLIVIDLAIERPNMQPENNLVNHLVYSGSKENVRLTMVNGRILYENGEFFIGEKPEDIYRRANEFSRRIAL